MKKLLLISLLFTPLIIASSKEEQVEGIPSDILEMKDLTKSREALKKLYEMTVKKLMVDTNKLSENIKKSPSAEATNLLNSLDKFAPKVDANPMYKIDSASNETLLKYRDLILEADDLHSQLSEVI